MPLLEGLVAVALVTFLLGLALLWFGHFTLALVAAGISGGAYALAIVLTGRRR